MFRLIALLLILGLPAAAQDVQRFNPRQSLSTLDQAPPVQIYISINGQSVGPLDAAAFTQHLGTPEAAANTYVWMPGMTDWALASTVAALQPIIAAMTQTGGDGKMAAPADPSAFMLGVWISEPYNWTPNDIKWSVIAQMKLLPDGRFEGATLYRDEAKREGPITISHEKGTWKVTPGDGGKFTLTRNMFYTNVEGGVVGATGQFEDTLTFEATGPNDVLTDFGSKFVRVPETQ
jgi:hypothetical protein